MFSSTYPLFWYFKISDFCGFPPQHCLKRLRFWWENKGRRIDCGRQSLTSPLVLLLSCTSLSFSRRRSLEMKVRAKQTQSVFSFNTAFLGIHFMVRRFKIRPGLGSIGFAWSYDCCAPPCVFRSRYRRGPAQQGGLLAWFPCLEHLMSLAPLPHVAAIPVPELQLCQKVGLRRIGTSRAMTRFS